MPAPLLWLRNQEFLIAGGVIRPADYPSNRCFVLSTSSGTPRLQETCTLRFARSQHTCTLLCDGSVLVVGGYGAGEVEADGVLRHRALKSAEVYCPATHTWRCLPPMNDPRVVHTTVLLRDGRAIVIGGLDQATEGGFGLEGIRHHRPLATTEIIDTDKWTVVPGPTLPEPRHSCAALLMPDDSVGVIGGLRGRGDPPDPDYSKSLRPPMTWRPSDPAWSPLPAEGVRRAAGHTATLIAEQRVILIGGMLPDARHGLVPTGSVETLDLGELRWRRNSECRPRANHSTTLLADGRILVIGGNDSGVGLRLVDLYDPTTDAWTSMGDLETARSGHFAGAISPSSVLVCGGEDAGPWFEVVSVPP